MENSLLVNFDEIWPNTLYYSTGTLARFLSNFENMLCRKFELIPIKIGFFTKGHVYVSENLIKVENSLLVNFDEIWPNTLYYSTGTLARFLSNFENL